MNKWIAFPLLAAVLAAGCAQTPSYQLSDAERAKYSQSPPEELIAQTEARLKQAQQDELPLYAPLSYRRAKASLDEALKNQQKRGAVEDLITSIAAANSRLDTGYKHMEKSRALLAPNLADDKRLQELQAPKLAAAEYKKLSAELNALYEIVDSGDTARAEKSRAALSKAQQTLKLRLIREQAFAEVRALHARIEKEDAAEVVPNAVAEANASYKSAQAFVDGHPDDAAGIASAANGAVVMAQRALWMAARARALARIDTDSTEVEKLLTEEEKWLTTIGEAMGGDTVRHLPPDGQAAALAERARRLKESVPPAAERAPEPAPSGEAATPGQP